MSERGDWPQREVITPKERLTATGAAILFVVLAAVITAIVNLAPPNLTLDAPTRMMTER